MHHNPAKLAGSTCYGFSYANVNTDDVIRVIYKHEYEQKTESEGGKNRTYHLDYNVNIDIVYINCMKSAGG